MPRWLSGVAAVVLAVIATFLRVPGAALSTPAHTEPPTPRVWHSAGYRHWRHVVHRRHLQQQARGHRIRRLVIVALQQRGVPYVWGGTSRRGFDCSGFVQYVYKRIGIYLPRTTWTQMSYGRRVSRTNLQTGDVVFTSGGGHEGLYLGRGLWIDAPHSGTVVGIHQLSYYGGYLAARRYL